MKDDFIKICPTTEVYNCRGRSFPLDDETEIALFKVEGKIYAIDNVCPHNHTPQMFDGYIEDMYVACPVHGFRFHLETGVQPTKLGCKLRTFETKIIDEFVYVKKPAKKLFNFHF